MFIKTHISKFRQNISAYLDHHLSTGDRIIVARNGRELGAFVSMKDFRALEEVEKNREEFAEQRHVARMREFRMLKEGQA